MCMPAVRPLYMIFLTGVIARMVRSGESMTMRRLPAIELPAQGTATLAPGGKHLMLIDLQRPLRAGEQREGILLFRDAGEVKVTLEVRTQ